MNAGSPTLAAVQEVNSADGQPETSAHKKLRKAAQEFEGMLISQLLGEFKIRAFLSHRGCPPGRVRYLELLGHADAIERLGQPGRAGNRQNAGSPARAQFDPRPLTQTSMDRIDRMEGQNN